MRRWCKNSSAGARLQLISVPVGTILSQSVRHRSSFSNSDCVCPRSSASVRSSTKPRHDVHRRIAPRGRRSWSAFHYNSSLILKGRNGHLDVNVSNISPDKYRTKPRPAAIARPNPPYDAITGRVWLAFLTAVVCFGGWSGWLSRDNRRGGVCDNQKRAHVARP